MAERYEYKVITTATKWGGFMNDRAKTEQRLNLLAQEGWELDQATLTWFGSTDLVLRRPR